MSPNWNSYYGGEGQPDAIAEIIGYKSVSTGTITRGSGTVTAKTVRLETLSGQRQVMGAGGMVYPADAYILAEFGVDIRVGDRFTVNGQTFEVIMFMPGHVDCAQFYLKIRG